MVGDHDRVLFLLDILPNNRLFTGRRIPVGTVRRIESNDIHREQTALSTGVASLDKISWGDLLYEATANGYEVFLVEDSQKIAGFIKLKIKEGNTLSIDVIANDETYKGKGIGGALMRFAENYGRANECRYLDLWSIEDQKEFYLKYGYQVKGEVLDAGDGERYIPMRRTLLYHFSVEMDEQDHIPAAHA
jgi:ribosomal protein S18 acetylase RimI-like enzyme